LADTTSPGEIAYPGEERRNNMDRQQAIDRLRDIQEEIGTLVFEAKEIIREFSPGEYDRAKKYWAAHIEGALSKSYGWLGGSFIDMDASINAIEAAEQLTTTTLGTT
jgi:hypothetical protein